MFVRCIKPAVNMGGISRKLVVFVAGLGGFNDSCRRMAAEGTSAIKNQVAIFHRTVIIDYFHDGIAFGAERIFQDALLNLNGYSAPKQGRLGCKFFPAHAENVSYHHYSHNFRLRSWA
jgi:hypothetical protein